MFNSQKDRRVQLAFKEDIEPHEILLDSLAKEKERKDGFSEKKFEVPLVKKILQGFLIFYLLLIACFLIKTFQLQILQGEELSALAQENKFIIHKIQAERGVIYDKNLKQLVFNLTSFDLICEKNRLPQEETERERVIKEVSQILQNDYLILKEDIEKSELSQILISENLSHQELILLETKIKELPGFQIKTNSIREYYSGSSFSQIVGYTSKITAEEFKENQEFYSINDYVGRVGVEKSYEEALRKNPGELRIERDALGNIISEEIISLPESGKSLVLWLDSDLQNKIEEELSKKLKELGTKKAAAIAMNPQTGGILSLVSFPEFDNNLFQKGGDEESLKALLTDPSEPLFNRAISGKYLTGSTIKPLIASAALEEDVVSPEKNINCQGFITVPHQYDPEIEYNFQDWTSHSWTDLRKAIAESCNVYFYTIGGGFGDQEGLGPTRIKEYLQLFGWTEKTGIDLPGESEGFVPDKEWKKRVLDEGWWDGNTYYLSIGQQYLQITPLEVITAFSAIANGGKLMQPQVVRKVVDTSSGVLKVLEEKEPRIIRENFISPENLQVVREGMRQAVTGRNSPQASAVVLNSLPVAVAAKTGTAELGNDRYHNWITVFAPYDNPQIVLTLMIENVKGVQAAVLPVARSVLEWYFTPTP